MTSEKRDYRAINEHIGKLCESPAADLQKRGRDVGLIVSIRGADEFVIEVPGGFNWPVNRFGAESFVLGYTRGLAARHAKARADE